jgi:hypothetical protein
MYSVGSSEGRRPLGSLKCTENEDVDWINLAQNTVKWRDLVDTVIIFVFHTGQNIY